MIKFLANEFNAEILYLVYKPVIKDLRNQISGKEVYKVAKVAANEGLHVAVDGPCINQCLAKKKFIDVDHAGNVFPCSFVREPMGNLLKSSLKDIWKNRGPQIKCPFVKFK
jgi:MoaA/NifB/PqqE/SkfB family radical SAM enzyme